MIPQKLIHKGWDKAKDTVLRSTSTWLNPLCKGQLVTLLMETQLSNFCQSQILRQRSIALLWSITWDAMSSHMITLLFSYRDKESHRLSRSGRLVHLDVSISSNTHTSHLDASGTHSSTCPSFSNEDSHQCFRFLSCQWAQVANFYSSVWPSFLLSTHWRGELSHPHSTQGLCFCCQETGLEPHTNLCDIIKVTQATILVD